MRMCQLTRKSLYIKILRQHEHVMTFCKVTNDSQIIYFKLIIIKEYVMMSMMEVINSLRVHFYISQNIHRTYPTAIPQFS